LTTMTTTMIVARSKLVAACVSTLALALMMPTGMASHSTPVVLVNCGSYKNATVNGLQWESDMMHEYYSTGGSTGLSQSSNQTVAAGDPNQAVLYSTYRRFEEHMDSPYRYVIHVPSFATYSVDLHFAEMEFTEAEKRIMNIAVQGIVVHANVDVFALAGGAGKPTTLTSIAAVMESKMIVIDFIAVTQSPLAPMLQRQLPKIWRPEVLNLRD
jgi:hypothetical protein